MGNQIEYGFLRKKKQTTYLQIESDELGTLAFNIGDSFESFLENNCFGDCSLGCPTRLNDNINPEDVEFDGHHFHVLQFVKKDEMDKKYFLLTDILNYVVLDTLFDFYNYEMGLDIDDSDVDLMQLADFITSIIEVFIETKGQQFLHNPKENASDLFEKLLADAETNWDDMLKSAIDDEPDHADEWKIGEYDKERLIDEFLSQQQKPDKNVSSELKVMNFVRNYLNEYAGIDQFDEISFEDLEEFYTFWLVRECMLENDLDPKLIKEILIRFFKWLELSKDINLSQSFNKVLLKNYDDFQNAVKTARAFFDKNSLIDGILASNNSDNEIVSGLFILEDILDNGLYRLRDAYLENKYTNVQINFPTHQKKYLEMIIDATFKPTMYGWRMVHLEYIFPKGARPYLH